MNGDLPTSRDTFITEDDPKRFKMHLYDILAHMTKQQQRCVDQCDRRFTRLENRKKVDTGIASALGLLGGFLSGIFGRSIAP